MYAKNPCDGCWYFRGNSDYDRCCCYYLITNIRRPCPPGKGCTVRVNMSMAKKSRKRFENQ